MSSSVVLGCVCDIVLAYVTLYLRRALHVWPALALQYQVAVVVVYPVSHVRVREVSASTLEPLK